MPLTTHDDATIWWAAEGPAAGAAAERPLLLIQGLGYTADMWFRVLPGLSEPRRTVRFDNRGVGRSSVPPTPWTIEEMADDAIAVLDAAGVARSHVFGGLVGRPGRAGDRTAPSHPRRGSRARVHPSRRPPRC